MALKEQAVRLIEAQADLKKQLKTALESKGVDVPHTALLKDYPGFVEDLEIKSPVVVSKTMPKEPVEGMLWIVAEPTVDESSSSEDQESESSSSAEDMVIEPLTFVAKESGVTITLQKIGEPTVAGLRFRINDSEEWTAYEAGTAIILENTDDVLYLENTLEYLSEDNENYVQFLITGTTEVSGNIQALMNYSYYVPYACYYRLFKDCTGITTTPYLPARSLGFNCYANMFEGCTNLTTAPELPATKLVSGCYAGMFKGCTNLINAPELGAEKMATYCYQEMFSGCIALATAPELPATELADSCYNQMFYGCTNLTAAPELPATELASNCYDSMFEGCRALSALHAWTIETAAPGSCIEMFKDCISLTDASVIDIVNTADSCCDGMFEGCTNLINTPKLSAATLSDSCYLGMFEGCISLTTAPSLPATSIAPYCYMSMFKNCSGLSLDDFTLPATELADSCYQGMFSGCTNLTTAPELPATELADSCYNQMFSGCSKLVKAPILGARKLVNNCYAGMFKDCPLLSELNVNFISWYSDNGYLCTSDWVKGVSSNGTFKCLTELSAEYGDSFIPVDWETYEAEWPEALTFTALEAGSVIKLTAYDVDIVGLKYRQHSTQQSTDYVSGTEIVLENVGDFVQFQNMKKDTLSVDHARYVQFDVVGNVEVSGKIASLHNYSNILTPYCYYRLFDECAGITSILFDLPATTLADWCYAYMFYNCTGITKAPEIRGEVLADSCYEYMFSGCTNLNYIKCGIIDPEHCRYWLYQAQPTGTLETVIGSDLTIKVDSYIPKGWYVTLDDGRPDISDTEWYTPLTITMTDTPGDVTISHINFGIRYSFDRQLWTTVESGEVTLTVTNKLFVEGLHPLTNTEVDYLKCLNITSTKSHKIEGNVHALIGYATKPAKGAFAYLFRRTINGGPQSVSKGFLPATVLADSCYNQMFFGCTNLTTAPELPATELASNCYHLMFKDCTNLTTTPELPATELADSCYAYMFYGCTNLTTAPELPATELADSCYANMFEGCTSLTTAPELPATELADRCYAGMFYGCTALEGVVELPARVLSTGCYTRMFYGTSAKLTPSVKFTVWSSSYTSGWLGSREGVYNEIIKPAALPNRLYTGSEGYTIPANAMIYNTGSDDYPDYKDKEWYTALKLAKFGEGHTSFSLSQQSAKDTEVYMMVIDCYDNENDVVPSHSYANIDGLLGLPEYHHIRLRCTNRGTSSVYKLSLFNPKFTQIIGGNIQSLSAFSRTATPGIEGDFFKLFGAVNIKELPATKLTEGCYSGLFSGCTNLATAPELPATELADSCYSGMFSGCTNLTTAPELPATVLAPECYFEMFKGCSKLSNVDVSFTTWKSGATDSWLSDVSTAGDFTKPMKLAPMRGESYIPDTWTIYDKED